MSLARAEQFSLAIVNAGLLWQKEVQTMLGWAVRASRFVALIIAVLVAAGCGDHVPPPAEHQSQTAAALDPIQKETFSITLPQSVAPVDSLLATTERLQVGDRVTLGESPAIKSVSNLGANGLELGASNLVHANVQNGGGSTTVRISTRIRGFLRAVDPITKQNPVYVEGGEFPNTPVPDAVTQWTVDWPTVNRGNVYVGDDQVTALDPGAYGTIDVRSRARVTLRSGTYFFESFASEPQAQLLLDKTNGPIFIYIRNQFRLYAELVTTGGLDGNLLVGYLGTLGADVQVAFTGTLVAPNAEISLRRPSTGQHRGAFFGRRIIVDSDGQVLHLPFDWGFLCPLGDTDGDGISDCSDQCGRDKSKVAPGICGCGVPETDGDSDRVPDCKDECPTDPNNVRRGQCGCAGDPDVKSAGTACTDGICAGLQQCNGAGRCGNPDSCRPEAGCVPYRFDDHSYWLCPARSWDQAQASCDGVPGVSLAKIDSPKENAFVGTVVTGATWTGANDRSAESDWRWSSVTAGEGAAFWSGGATGSRIASRYVNWRQGEPNGGDTDDCGSVTLGGRWSDDACSSARPYLCETSIQLTPRPTPAPGCPPGATCSPAPPRSPTCVSLPAAELAAAEAQVRDCAACGSDQSCVDTKCVGAAAPAPAGSTCSAFTADEKAFCEIDPGTEVGSCSRENPTCPSGTQCGLLHRCHDIFKDGSVWRARSCAEGCQTGHYCGPKGYCVNPNLSTACDAATVEEEVCYGQCFGEFACGAPDSDCAANDAPDSNPCQEVEICSTPDLSSPTLDATSDVTASTFDPAATFQQPSEPTGTTYPAEDPPCPIGADGRVVCDLNESHPWCHYGVDGSLADKPVRDGKQGSRGDGTIVQFDFDPNVELDFEGDPLPFGEMNYRVRAAASFRAATTFDIGVASDTVEVVDAMAAMQATRCRLDTNETRLEVFGLDFLPILGIDAKLDTNDIFPTDDCEQAVQTFVEAAGRAKKALRDAQELVRQYEALRAQGTSYGLSLCEAIASEPPANFPALPADVTCETESPEATVNRFIQFANEEAARIKTAQDTLGAETLSSAKAHELGIAPLTFDRSSEESQTIVNITFFVGPVPANLSVEAVLAYGLRGTLGFDLAPGAVLQESDSDIVGVTADAEPFANAAVRMFVGAGIDFGGLALKAGVSGDISLGDISLPAYAGAGIRIQPEEDPRRVPEDLPADLQAMSTGQTAFPFDGKNRMYRLALAYRYGASFKLDRILAGHIDARVKVKFFFFSKTWKKKILDFGDGFGFGTVPLLNGGGELGIADDIYPWGLIRMPTPLVKLKPLVEGAFGPAIGSGSSVPEPLDGELEAPAAADPISLAFDTGRVEELFYDSLCTCKAAGADCRRNADCCADAPVCFDDPSPSVGPKCSGCRGAGASCNVDSDCCAGGCSDGRCSSCISHGSSCSTSSALGCCNSEDSCFAPTGQTTTTCTCVPLGERCRDVGECCSSANTCSDDPDTADTSTVCRALIIVE
jgi:hypothetical protein